MEGTDPGQVLPQEGSLVKTFRNNEKWTSAWRREVVKTSERVVRGRWRTGCVGQRDGREVRERPDGAL